MCAATLNGNFWLQKITRLAKSTRCKTTSSKFCDGTCCQPIYTKMWLILPVCNQRGAGEIRKKLVVIFPHRQDSVPRCQKRSNPVVIFPQTTSRLPCGCKHGKQSNVVIFPHHTKTYMQDARMWSTTYETTTSKYTTAVWFKSVSANNSNSELQLPFSNYRAFSSIVTIDSNTAGVCQDRLVQSAR